MRRLGPVLLASIILLSAAAARPVAAAPIVPHAPQPSITAQAVDDNDDTRVEVQLAVLGVAAFVVVGIGLAAFVLRKKLGLVPPPPEQGGGGHH